MGNLADQLAAKFAVSEEKEQEQPEGTLARLALIIADVTGIEAQEITAGTPLREGLGTTSLDLVTITVRTEETFGVPLESRTVADFDTVGDVVEFLDNTSA
ncbi:acyl carrier protein [Corynebacterium lowii]|uniref:Meromycolate extension acyl carrier protein n=1 Tax=Corynebacterium lowii TaxID=1544413 RepID=A0A0Q1E2N4_9CORY|nr:phosphopantetheine-binding protein [Corynebacterium lowii]KQB86845.1 Meromycolate extension acyl carrier protein [Corynebacterium lowii]MDP9851533.1 acyl carrier protein [Corynebacterium lowii]